jgi:hypothetical protein
MKSEIYLNESLGTYSKLNLKTVDIDLENLNWVQYNPRKKIARWGASITSLNGDISGVPDLDSLYEYNKENGTTYTEMDFKTVTRQGEIFSFFYDLFQIGRSHFIRLGSGGFFPFHRDVSSETFRIIYCIRGCNENNLIWLQNRSQISLQDRTWYYINTREAHSTFSFFGSEFAVFNVVNNERSLRALVNCLEIR